MPRNPTLFAPLASIVMLLSGPPATAQTDADRTQYLPRYDIALRDLQKEVNAIAELQTQLEKETDLVGGCGLLNDSLAHLKAADKLLTDIEFYTDKLRMGKENRAAKSQHARVTEDIGLKEGDIARLCADVPPPQS